MKPLRHIVLLLAAVATLTVMGQPQATVLERRHDFGVIREEDGKVTCQVRLVNTGTLPLLVEKAQAGCGCTGVSYPESPVNPGDTATVDISYNPSGRPGQFTKQVILFTNTLPRRTVLEITGNVIPTAATLDKQYPLAAGRLRVSKADIPFGELVKGKNKTQFLSCYNASTDTLVVTARGGKTHVIPAVVPDTVLPAQVAALTVHYHSGDAPLWGLNVDTLQLSCRPLMASRPESTAIVHVMAQVIEDFETLTDRQRRDAPVAHVDCGERLDLGNLTAGETATRRFTITNKGKNPLIVRRLWAPDGEGITIQADRQEVKRGKTATVTVTVDTARRQGAIINEQLTLMTNDPASPRRAIRLVGIIDNNLTTRQ